METMHILSSRFSRTLEALRLPALPCPILQLAPAALRFQIGGKGGPYLADHRKPSGAYLQEALDRAMALYAALPQAPDLLRIDRDKAFAEDLPLSALRKLGLPDPEEVLDTGSREFFFWHLPPEPPFLRSLLREILRAELDAEGLDALTGNVYFLSTGVPLLYHLCDDRYADLAAGERESLLPLYRKYEGWLEDNSREQAELLFSDSVLP